MITSRINYYDHRKPLQKIISDSLLATQKEIKKQGKKIMQLEDTAPSLVNIKHSDIERAQTYI